VTVENTPPPSIYSHQPPPNLGCYCGQDMLASHGDGGGGCLVVVVVVVVNRG